MQPNLINLKNQALALISQVNDKKELDRLQVDYLGRKGQINQISEEIQHVVCYSFSIIIRSS